jgi:hypothetical protein
VLDGDLGEPLSLSVLPTPGEAMTAPEPDVEIGA